MTAPRNYHDALSQNVRRLRNDREWSLDELAKRSGVSRAMIVQVEGARTNASLATICQLADALAVPVQTLLAIADQASIRVVRGSEGAILWSDRRGSSARLLSVVTGHNAFELWQWRLAPQAKYDSAAHAVGTRETLWIHRGTLTVHVRDASGTGGPCDTIQFDAGLSHRYESAGRVACEFSMVVELPVAAKVSVKSLPRSESRPRGAAKRPNRR